MKKQMALILSIIILGNMLTGCAPSDNKGNSSSAPESVSNIESGINTESTVSDVLPATSSGDETTESSSFETVESSEQSSVSSDSAVPSEPSDIPENTKKGQRNVG